MSFAKGFQKVAWDASQGNVSAPSPRPLDQNKVKDFTKGFNGGGKNQTGLANLNTLGGLIPKGIF